MFAKTIMSVAAVVALASSSMAAPMPSKRYSSSAPPISFNNYGGFSQLSNFDSFYGSDNFSGFSNQITEVDSETVVCEDQSIEIVQQQLSVLREFAKSIITQTICQVEVQTIVYGQFISGLSDFSSDLSRSSGRSVGFDKSIASHISDLTDSSGNLVSNNLGFQGSSIGSNYVVPTGNNWQDSSSPLSVGSAHGLAIAAGGSSA